MNHFVIWLDIQNRKITITISCDTEFITEMIEFSKTESGKKLIYVFSVGDCNEEFTSVYEGMIEDFEKQGKEQFNYVIKTEVNAYEIIPEFEEHVKNVDRSKSVLIKFESKEKEIEA